MQVRAPPAWYPYRAYNTAIFNFEKLPGSATTRTEVLNHNVKETNVMANMNNKAKAGRPYSDPFPLDREKGSYCWLSCRAFSIA